MACGCGGVPLFRVGGVVVLKWYAWCLNCARGERARVCRELGMSDEAEGTLTWCSVTARRRAGELCEVLWHVVSMWCAFAIVSPCDESCSLIVRFERGKHRFRERVDPQEINTVHKEICLKPPKSPRSIPIKASRVSVRHNPNNEQDSWNVRNVHRFEFDMIDCRLCRLIRRDVFGSGRHPSSSAVCRKKEDLS